MNDAFAVEEPHHPVARHDGARPHRHSLHTTQENGLLKYRQVQQLDSLDQLLHVARCLLLAKPLVLGAGQGVVQVAAVGVLHHDVHCTTPHTTHGTLAKQAIGAVDDGFPQNAPVGGANRGWARKHEPPTCPLCHRANVYGGTRPVCACVAPRAPHGPTKPTN